MNFDELKTSLAVGVGNPIDPIYNNNRSNNNNNTDDNDDKWTLECLKDKLYCQLMSIKNNGGESKYENQARDLLYRIGIYHPTPSFIIYYSDLSPRLKKELESLSDIDLNIVLYDVISWILESINKEYFLLGVKRYGLLQWRIEE